MHSTLVRKARDLRRWYASWTQYSINLDGLLTVASLIRLITPPNWIPTCKICIPMGPLAGPRLTRGAGKYQHGYMSLEWKRGSIVIQHYHLPPRFVHQPSAMSLSTLIHTIQVKGGNAIWHCTRITHAPESLHLLNRLILQVPTLS